MLCLCREYAPVKNERPAYKDHADVLRLMRAYKGLETRAIIKIAFYTNMRWGVEILKLAKRAIRGDLFSLEPRKTVSPTLCLFIHA